ncbi:hypothetical protein Tcan_12743 [Toxocara canis]|uniref:Uncharacterized protein n=1 Tax=Toxocara canis TaxID=6265 RepID=A0A0B2VNV4_TOXCA|nr:hypothetical protein Tcan_12743 [Toxocara canis]
MGRLVEPFLVLGFTTSMVSASLTKCYAKGAKYRTACFSNQAMAPGDYLWVRMRVAKYCQPDGYAMVQLGHSWVSYSSHAGLDSVTSGTKHVYPHWITRKSYRARMQLRISERRGSFRRAWIRYGWMQNAGSARPFYDRDEREEYFVKGVQDEYYDIKIMQLANGAFAVFFNGKYTGAVGKENWKGFSEEVNPANVFELYRSQEPGKSDFVKEDIVSLEGTAYLHPLIANLQPGGLPIGGVIKIAVLLARPLEVIFVTRESKPTQWKLTINRKQTRWDYPDSKHITNDREAETYSARGQWDIWNTIEIVNLGTKILVSVNIPFEVTEQQLEGRNAPKWMHGAVATFPAVWDGEIKRVIVRDSEGDNLQMSIRYAYVSVNIPFEVTEQQLEGRNAPKWMHGAVATFPAVWDGEIKRVIVRDSEGDNLQMSIRYAYVSNDLNSNAMKSKARR